MARSRKINKHLYFGVSNEEYLRLWQLGQAMHVTMAECLRAFCRTLPPCELALEAQAALLENAGRNLEGGSTIPIQDPRMEHLQRFRDGLSSIANIGLAKTPSEQGVATTPRKSLPLLEDRTAALGKIRETERDVKKYRSILHANPSDEDAMFMLSTLTTRLEEWHRDWVARGEDENALKAEDI